MNKTNFEITKSLLRANSDHVSMIMYVHKGTIGYDKVDGKLAAFYSDCNTVGCVAGHISAYLNGVVTEETPQSKIFLEAEEFLGLYKDQAIGLFNVADWPAEYKQKLYQTTLDRNRKDYVEVVSERMDYMLETGE